MTAISILIEYEKDLTRTAMIKVLIINQKIKLHNLLTKQLNSVLLVIVCGWKTADQPSFRALPPTDAPFYNHQGFVRACLSVRICVKWRNAERTRDPHTALNSTTAAAVVVGGVPRICHTACRTALQSPAHVGTNISCVSETLCPLLFIDLSLFKVTSIYVGMLFLSHSIVQCFYSHIQN